jgi:hypothetical protein
MTAVTPAPSPALGLPGRVVLVLLVLLGVVLGRGDPFTFFFFLSYASVGALLAVRRPRNVIGWLLVGIGCGFAATTVPVSFDPAALLAGAAPLADFLAVWLGSWAGYATFTAFFALTLIFPSGQLPAGRWRRSVIAMLATCTLLTVLAATGPTTTFSMGENAESIRIPNRFAVLPSIPLWELVSSDLLILPIVLLMAIGAASMVVRYRRSTGILRLQLRWLVAAVAFVVVAIPIGLVLSSLGSTELATVAWVPAIVAYPTVPVAIYVAVTRHGLYDLDRIISRTLAWVVLTAMLAAVFGGAVIALQSVLAPVTANNTLAVAASTLLAAALFQPLRRRVQGLVDRRFNRARVDAQRSVDALGAHLRGEVALEAVHARLLGTVEAAVQPAAAGVWIRAEHRP